MEARVATKVSTPRKATPPKATSVQPTVTLEEITPEIAEKYLSRSKVIRKLRNRKVTEYADDMKAGLWRVADGMVCFDEEDWLIQGQHRLSACVKANVPFTTWVARGIERDTQEVMDTGLKRSLADTLHARGEINTTQLAALLRGDWLRRIDPQMSIRHHAPSHSTLLAMLDTEPDVYREAVRLSSTMYSGTRYATTMVWGVTWLMLNEVQPVDESDDPAKDAEDFFHLVRTGENMGPGNPIYALRRLLGNMDSVQTNERRRQFGVIFKAWNMWRAGEKTDVLMFRTGGKQPEKMPVLK
jgi:hypothetical protein